MRLLSVLALCFLLPLCLLADDTSSEKQAGKIRQEQKEHKFKDELFFEVGGPIPFVSLNFQKAVINDFLFMRSGIGMYTQLGGKYLIRAYSWTSALMVVAHPIKSKGSSLEVGLGPQLSHTHWYLDKRKIKKAFGIGVTSSLGYRFDNKKFSFRTGLSAYYNSDIAYRFFPYIGIGLRF